MLKAVAVEWACIFLSAVARFHVLVGIPSVVVAVVVAACCVGVGDAVVAVVVARLL